MAFRINPLSQKLEICGGKLINPDKNIWEDLGSANQEHMPAVFAMRSKTTPGGHANQCSYDINGNIMTDIPAGGTADFVSNSSSSFGHFLHDLNPWWLAKKLKRQNDYYNVRPVIVAP